MCLGAERFETHDLDYWRGESLRGEGRWNRVSSLTPYREASLHRVPPEPSILSLLCSRQSDEWRDAKETEGGKDWSESVDPDARHMGGGKDGKTIT